VTKKKRSANKLSAKNKTGQARKKQLSEQRQKQLMILGEIALELQQLHMLSLIDMENLGVLPPLYAGSYLGEAREVIPMWGITKENGEPELASLHLRVVDGVEIEPTMVEMRKSLELENTWKLAELLDMLVMPDGKPAVNDVDHLREMDMLLSLFGTQVNPAPGYDRDEMFQHMAEKKPYAVFVWVPTKITDDEMEYLWDDLESFKAEVVYAETPPMLAAAVWEYRLNLDLNAERAEILSEGGDPAEEMMAQTVDELASQFDMLVSEAATYYGTTSPPSKRNLTFCGRKTTSWLFWHL
jgi:hypothetical protein